MCKIKKLFNKWLRWIFRHLIKNVESENNRRKTEMAVRRHWIGNPISLTELIQERWQPKPSDGQKIEEFNYVVFIDCDGDIDWITNDEYAVNKMPERAASFIANIGKDESIPTSSIGERHALEYKRMLCRAIVSVLEGDEESSRNIQNHAIAYLQNRINERSRFLTLFFTTVLTVALYFGISHLLETTTVCVWGLFGAALSLVQRSARRDADANAGFMLHLMEVFVFLLTGIMLGYLGVAVLKSDIAPQLLQPLAKTDNGEIIMAFISGMMQGFIPSMIGKYVLASQESNK